MLDDKNSGVPLYRQIYEAIRRAILSGEFESQRRLPATRSLAKQIGVSRLTVVNAYEQLLAEDYLEGKTGAATFVAAELPEEFLQTPNFKQQERKDARLVYVTPSHQFPLGLTMSLARRLSLLEWAREAEAWIVEDDYNSEYRYAGRPLASLQGLDRHGRVIYLGTFSKTIFPALRLGCVVVPPDLVEIFTAARAMTDVHSPLIEQAILAEFIAEGHFARHLRRMRALYEQHLLVFLKIIAVNRHPLLRVE